jgi:probable F420-dependent oxidoreductase
VKFGVQLPHFGPLASGEGTLALARRAEALGYDSVWVGDHIVYPPPLAERFGGEFYEAVTTLSFVAAHPLVLAKQLATLDALSGGRLILGVGAGWLEEEYRALGAPFAERGAATDEYLKAMRTLWTAERPRFAGKFVTFPEVLFAPRPRATLRVWVGGNSPRALRRAAELGDGWLPIWHAATGRGFTPPALRDKCAELERLRARAGRGGQGEVAALMPLAITDRASTHSPEPLVGAADAIVEMLRRYRDAGLGHVILTPYYGLPAALLPKLEEVERLLAAFAGDIRPRL